MPYYPPPGGGGGELPALIPGEKVTIDGSAEGNVVAAFNIQQGMNQLIQNYLTDIFSRLDALENPPA